MFETQQHLSQEHMFDPKTCLLFFKLEDAGNTGQEANIWEKEVGGSTEYFKKMKEHIGMESPTSNSNKVGMIPQYPYGLSSLYL